MNLREQIVEMLKVIEITKAKNNIEKNVLLYYKHKYASNTLTKSNMSYLETIICEDIMPKIIPYGELYVNVFKEDLMKLVKSTSNYSRLYYFESFLFKPKEL